MHYKPPALKVGWTIRKSSKLIFHTLYPLLPLTFPHIPHRPVTPRFLTIRPLQVLNLEMPLKGHFPPWAIKPAYYLAYRYRVPFMYSTSHYPTMSFVIFPRTPTSWVLFCLIINRSLLTNHNRSFTTSNPQVKKCPAIPSQIN
jgi:hypothetical protein